MTTKHDPWRGAVVDGPYRYRLWRVLRATPGLRCVFVMLNPSTADARVDDPTLRRCIGFASDLGFQRLDVVNLFAWRATDPRWLRRRVVDDGHAVVIGPENDRHIVATCVGADLVIAAWGAHGSLGDRDLDVVRLLESAGVVLHMLDVTVEGQPRHPLYLPRSARPRPMKLSAGWRGLLERRSA